MKKKLLILLSAFTASTTYIYAQSSETRTLAAFTKIIINGNSKVYLTPASPQEVRVETKNKLDEITTSVSDGTLKIDGKPSSIYINVPSLEEITISGYGEVKSDGTYKTESMRLVISGNGKIKMPIETKTLDVDISGFGKMKLSGNTETMSLAVSGNGTVDAEDLTVKMMTATISGVGKATVDVTEKLNMSVSGVGSVFYKTEPKEIIHDMSGVGKYGLIHNKEDGDTTTIHMGDKRIVIIDNKKKDENYDHHDDDDDMTIDIDHDLNSKKPRKAQSHWAGFDIGFNGYFNDGTSSDLPPGYDFLELNSGKSVAVNINFWAFDFPVYKRYIMLTTGLGMSLNNYYFSTDKTLIADTNMVVAGYDYNNAGEQISYSKNKLAVNYFTIPVLLQFNTDHLNKKSFHLATGMLLSYKYNSHLKLVYDNDGDKQKTKRSDEYSIEPFRYDATVRLGYRNYTLFGTYALSELFKDSRGPSLHPYTIGLQLVGW